MRFRDIQLFHMQVSSLRNVFGMACFVDTLTILLYHKTLEYGNGVSVLFPSGLALHIAFTH